MSSELTALIVRNDLNLPKERVDSLLALAARKGLFPLAADKEPGAFLLYCLGDELDVIAAKMNLPREVIIASAINYRWPEKAKLLNRDNEAMVPLDLQKELVNTILVATVVAMQRELGDVIAGRKDAKDCRMIPSSPASLEKLLALVTTLNTPKGEGGQPGQDVRTVVHAENVQIVQNQGLPLPSQDSPEKTESRRLMLAELEKAT